MFRKTALSLILAMLLTVSAFHLQASAASTVIFCLELSCSSMTGTFGGQTHPTTLNCSRNISWTGIPAGTYATSVAGCGLRGSGSIRVDGTSTYTVSWCPPTGFSCCSDGCGEGGAYNCSACRASDDHGNTCSAATAVGVNSTIHETTNSAGDYDYFRVQPTSAGTLTVYTTGSTDTYGYLKNSSCSNIVSNDDGGSGTNFRISRSVTAGTYYIAVRHASSSGTGLYILRVRFEPEDDDVNPP
jgi:hypothetical protein